MVKTEVKLMNMKPSKVLYFSSYPTLGTTKSYKSRSRHNSHKDKPR